MAGTKRIELLPMVSKTTVPPLYDVPMCPYYFVILREVSGITLTSVSYLTPGAASRI